MNDTSEQPKRGRGRPRLVTTAVRALQRQQARQVHNVMRKVEEADFVSALLIRAWLANELGLTPMELDSHAHAVALKAYLTEHPDRANDFVQFRTKQEKTP